LSEKISLRLDPDALTIGDLEDFEDGVGVPLYEALKPTVVKDEDGNKVLDEKGRPETEVKVSSKALKYLVWIVHRNEVEGFTLEDARKVRVGSLELIGDDDDSGNDESGEPKP
jgi:hypothetical protein